MATLTDLVNNMNKLRARIPAFANETKQDAASTILTDLVQVTPVDTGEALSNWVVGLDAPFIGEISPYVPSPKGRMKGGVWTHKVDPVITAQANIQPTLDSGLPVIKRAKPGQPIYIANNVDQIVTLDQGSSSQAPAGFVDRAVILGEQVVSRAKL